MDMERLLYTVSEAAGLLGFSRATVYVMMGKGELESVKIGLFALKWGA